MHRTGVKGPPSSGVSTAHILTWADKAFVVLVFFIAAGLVDFGLHSKAWALAYLYFLLRIALCLPSFLTFLRRNLAYLAYPALCLVSVIWSHDPIDSVRFSIQLSVSVLMALFIGMRFSIREIFMMLMWVLLFMVILSLLNVHGAIVDPYDDRGNYRGIFISKNTLGQRLTLFVISCIFMVFLVESVALAKRLLYLGAMLAAMFLIAISGSASGQMLTVVMAIGSVALYLIFSHRGGLAIVVAPQLLLLIGAIFAVSIWQVDLVELALGLVGRDDTLTGRTVLWNFGWEVYATRPLLGFGAAGMWTHPDFLRPTLELQSFYGEGVLGFHNLIVEMLVRLGPLGLVAHGLVGYTTLARSIGLATRTRCPLAVWGIVTTLTLYAIALFDTQLYRQHDLALILLIAVGAALTRSK